jgi:hypothetical protein
VLCWLLNCSSENLLPQDVALVPQVLVAACILICGSRDETMPCGAVLIMRKDCWVVWRTCYIRVVPPQHMLPTDNTGEVLSHKNSAATTAAAAAQE